MSNITEHVGSWLDDRLGLRAARELASHKTVPMHRYSVFYYLGGITLFFFMVQIATGVLLMLYYRPGAEEAFESVEFIMTTVPFGWLIRSIHSWSANLMVFFAFIHLASVFFLKAYRPPRELTWITGVLLFFLILGFGFSGYLLPWNQLAFFATKVGTDIAGVVPIAGEWTLRFLRGGDRVTGATLSRFFGWHVAILPAISLVILGIHLALVQTKGMSVPPAVEEEAKRRQPMKFFPHFALRDLTGWVLALAVLAALAALFPWELGEKADPFAPAYEDIKPEWYYIFMFQTLKLVPGGEIAGVEYEAIPILLFSLGGLVMMLVPFLDRGAAKSGRSPGFSIGGIGAVIFIVGMTCWGYKSLLPLAVVIMAALLLLVFALITRGPRTAALVIALLMIAGRGYAQTSCVKCHDSEMIDAQGRTIAHNFSKDVHAQVGLSCHDCHGGNPDPKLADDMTAAMDPNYKPHPFAGKPDRKSIPEFCGHCHSNAEFMKRFNPAARVDQVNEYWTSHHGRRLKNGDTNVATCVDCHSVHVIKRKNAADSPVYPTHVAETCARCHSNAKLMANYKDDGGRPLPTDQYARWRVSVHANAMIEKGDLSAPTCNDCHGNHGATPPGVESVSFVCGKCHAREAELFRASGKHEAWTRHNDYLASGSACNTCHDDKRAQIQLTHFGECVTCHENHGVIRPTIAMFGGLPETPCAFCHEGVGPLASRVAEPKAKAEHFIEFRTMLLKRAEALGLHGDARFDWLVDQAQQLPTHIQKGKKDGEVRLRPEFARLFQKFRIGKTHYSYRDASGKDSSVAVRRCTDCHAGNDTGVVAANANLQATRGLTSMIGRSERILLAAQRGGVEVRKVRAELDGAVGSQIEMAALVHTFAAKDIQAKQTEGLQHAEAALIAGQASLDELNYRRRGLLVAVGIIFLVLIGLTAKIKTL